MSPARMEGEGDEAAFHNLSQESAFQLSQEEETAFSQETAFGQESFSQESALDLAYFDETLGAS